VRPIGLGDWNRIVRNIVDIEAVGKTDDILSNARVLWL